MIATLDGKYRFLSNFWSCFIEVPQGIFYPSVENAYQACKCADVEDRRLFENIKSSEARRLGRIVRIRPDWNEIRIDIMTQLVRQKFGDEYLGARLLATIDEHIEEGNWWGDTFWGTCNGVGENQLGKILMLIRRELQNG